MNTRRWGDGDPPEDDADLLLHYAGEPPRPAREHRVHGYRPRREREGGDRLLQWGVLLVAAVAGFSIPLMFGLCSSADSPRVDESAKLQSELQSAQDRVGQLESELSPARESVGKAAAPAPERRASEPQQQNAPPPTPPAAKQEARSELTPEEVLRLEPPIARPEAPREGERPATTAPPAISPPSPTPSREPDVVALADSQGAVSVYAVPDPAAPIVRSISPVLQVLAPERAGWTAEARPTLYWHASESIGIPGQFTLVREGEDEPLLRGRLAAPDEAGMQRIELSQSDVSLEEGVSYRWTVSFDDPAHSGTDRTVGGIRRVASCNCAISDAPSVTQRLDALERAGLWYDALDLVTRSIEDNSGAKDLVARRRAMLAGVGIYVPSS